MDKRTLRAFDELCLTPVRPMTARRSTRFRSLSDAPARCFSPRSTG
jgi:hypothetical protein